MELENFLCKTLDVFLIWRKKYPNKKIAIKLYYEVYAPIVNNLLPFMRNYDGAENDKLADVLYESRAILMDNYAISNPAHIKRIDKIIKSDKTFNKYTSSSKRAQKRYEKSKDKKRIKKDKKYRKNAFEYFIHDILVEYNILRKTLGIKRLSMLQRITIDQIEYNDQMSNIKTICIFFIIILLFYVVIPIVILFNNL